MSRTKSTSTKRQRSTNESTNGPPTKRRAKAMNVMANRPANAMPSVAEMNTVVQSNTTKRDRTLIALATVSALGAAGAACGSSQACKKAVMSTATKVGTHMKTAGEQVGKSVGQVFRRLYPATQK
jgi:uncharacterized protein HemX